MSFVAQVLERRPHIVVIDQNVDHPDGTPHLKGSDLAAELHRSGDDSNRLVCILTGASVEEVDELRARPGVDLAFSKGTDATVLSAALRRSLAAKRAKRNAPTSAASAAATAAGASFESKQLSPAPSPAIPERLRPLYEICCCDERYFIEMCQTVLEEIPPLLEELQAFIEAGDLDKASKSAHRLKGSVRGAGLVFDQEVVLVEQQVKRLQLVTATGGAAGGESPAGLRASCMNTLKLLTAKSTATFDDLSAVVVAANARF